MSAWLLNGSITRKDEKDERRELAFEHGARQLEFPRGVGVPEECEVHQADPGQTII